MNVSPIIRFTLRVIFENALKPGRIFKYHEQCKFLMCTCVVPENIHTSPTDGIFSETPPHPSGNSKLHMFLYIFWSQSQEIPIPSVGGGGGEYGYFLDLHSLLKLWYDYSFII